MRWQRRGRLPQYGSAYLKACTSVKGKRAGSKLVEHDSQRPDVRAYVRDFSLQLFRSHVGQCACGFTGIQICSARDAFERGVLDAHGESEVQDFELARGRYADVW